MRQCRLFKEAISTRLTLLFTFIALIIFLIDGCLQAQAQTSTLEASIDDLETLTGCSETQVKAAAISDQTFPTDDKSKIFFLYNVKTGLLLNAGGYWGTHVSLQEYGMPLWIHLDSDQWIHLAQKFDKSDAGQEEGNYLEYETTGNKDEDKGVYVDRGYLYTYSNNSHSYGSHSSYGSYTTSTIVKRGWKMEAVSGKTNTYKLYTYLNNSSSPTTSASFVTTKYYLIAAKEQGDVDKNCGAVAEGSSDIAEGSDEWRFISYQQIFELQDKKTENIVNSLDLTFRLQCPGFNRENGALSNWKTYKYGGKGQIRFGLEHYYKSTDSNGNIGSTYTDDFANKTISSYTFPDGTSAKTFTEHGDYERYCGKYYCADVKDSHGAIYQDIKVSHGGAYVVECKGFSTTTKAKLFAVMLNSDGSSNKKTLHATILGQTAYMSEAEKTALHVEAQNMDYAGKEFYGNHKYISSVLVQVPEGGGTIRFGIEIGSENDKEPTTSDEWTVFDDFRLLYTSKTTDGDLVLDELRDNLDYLKDCSNTYKSVTLHLRKKFDKDKWNGFTLPVNLTRDQLTQAFGPNVKLAKLAKLTDTEIQFESVDMDKAGNNEVVMKAYLPYIIFPTKHLELEQTPAYTALLSTTGNTETKDVHVTIAKNHIDIPNVTMATNSENKNDLSSMNTSNWTTNSSIAVDGTGTPFIQGNGKMTAYGTFARTFGEANQETTESDDKFGEWEFTEGTKSTIIDGRSDLKGCYFFANGNMYYSATRARGLRGFSVWFAPETTVGASAKVTTFLDGVALNETTGINSVSYSSQETKIEKFAQGIYSLNGQLISQSQSLDGLPNGIYIVNGKKVLKK